jgi:hypothetical protein
MHMPAQPAVARRARSVHLEAGAGQGGVAPPWSTFLLVLHVGNVTANINTPRREFEVENRRGPPSCSDPRSRARCSSWPRRRGPRARPTARRYRWPGSAAAWRTARAAWPPARHALEPRCAGSQHILASMFSHTTLTYNPPHTQRMRRADRGTLVRFEAPMVSPIF